MDDSSWNLIAWTWRWASHSSHVSTHNSIELGIPNYAKRWRQDLAGFAPWFRSLPIPGSQTELLNLILILILILILVLVLVCRLSLPTEGRFGKLIPIDFRRIWNLEPSPISNWYEWIHWIELVLVVVNEIGNS